MCDFCSKTTDAAWRNIAVGQRYRTPDLYRGIDFTIEEKKPGTLPIFIIVSLGIYPLFIDMMAFNLNQKLRPGVPRRPRKTGKCLNAYVGVEKEASGIRESENASECWP